MSKKKLAYIHEYGTLIIEGTKLNLKDKEDCVEIPKDSFRNLWDSVLESNLDSSIDNVFTLCSKNKNEYIKCGKYVGTVQTNDGFTIEILPKIYGVSDLGTESIQTCRKIFLNMLRHVENKNPKNCGYAGLSTSSSISIMDYYISKYLDDVESLVRSGVLKNYSRIKENSSVLKGKLLVNDQLTKNYFDKTHFSVEYDKYLEDIPQNRIIVTTLKYLSRICIASSVRNRILKIISSFSEIPESTNITSDINKARNSNRFYSVYDEIIEISSQYLMNKGFSVFSGRYINYSFLFSAENLFQDYIAEIFKDYSKRHGQYNVYSQHKKYFLVDNHSGDRIFKLKTDIFAESKDTTDFWNYQNIIIDTKWKLIDENFPKKNYLINISDMYQLYAYGQRYKKGTAFYSETTPYLIMIYPYTENFTNTLDDFIYDDNEGKLGLKLTVCPFDLSKTSTLEEIDNQIEKILCDAGINNYESELENPIFIRLDELLNSDSSLTERSFENERLALICNISMNEFIYVQKKNLFAINIGSNKNKVNLIPTRIFFIIDSKQAVVFSVNQNTSFIFSDQDLTNIDYPSVIENNYYQVYNIEEEVKEQPLINIDRLREHINFKKTEKPVFVYY